MPELPSADGIQGVEDREAGVGTPETEEEEDDEPASEPGGGTQDVADDPEPSVDPDEGQADDPEPVPDSESSTVVFEDEATNKDGQAVPGDVKGVVTGDKKEERVQDFAELQVKKDRSGDISQELPDGRRFARQVRRSELLRDQRQARQAVRQSTDFNTPTEELIELQGGNLEPEDPTSDNVQDFIVQTARETPGFAEDVAVSIVEGVPESIASQGQVITSFADNPSETVEDLFSGNFGEFTPDTVGEVEQRLGEELSLAEEFIRPETENILADPDVQSTSFTAGGAAAATGAGALAGPTAGILTQTGIQAVDVIPPLSRIGQGAATLNPTLAASGLGELSLDLVGETTTAATNTGTTTTTETQGSGSPSLSRQLEISRKRARNRIGDALGFNQQTNTQDDLTIINTGETLNMQADLQQSDFEEGVIKTTEPDSGVELVNLETGRVLPEVSNQRAQEILANNENVIQANVRGAETVDIGSDPLGEQSQLTTEERRVLTEDGQIEAVDQDFIQDRVSNNEAEPAPQIVEDQTNPRASPDNQGFQASLDAFSLDRKGRASIFNTERQASTNPESFNVGEPVIGLDSVTDLSSQAPTAATTNTQSTIIPFGANNADEFGVNESLDQPVFDFEQLGLGLDTDLVGFEQFEDELIGDDVIGLENTTAVSVQDQLQTQQQGQLNLQDQLTLQTNASIATTPQTSLNTSTSTSTSTNTSTSTSTNSGFEIDNEDAFGNEFTALVKEGNEFEPIGEFNTASDAFDAAVEEVETTDDMTFQVVDEAGTAVDADPARDFRESKTTDGFVELRDDAINTPGEFQDITAQSQEEVVFPEFDELNDGNMVEQFDEPLF